MDGIDAALVRFGDHACEIVATVAAPYPDELRQKLIAATRRPGECMVDLVGQLDTWVGTCFRDAALELVDQAGVDAGEVAAIGSHGQTIRHQPRAARPFTLQIGDPNVIAAGTGIVTVADFRRRDLADGGEGAPLAPAFHRWLFSHESKRRAVLNIGGIANVTMLDPGSDTVTGFDTGPGNTLLDGWISSQRGAKYDAGGAWAAEGIVNETLLGRMLGDPYFAQPAPKSTGFEYFNSSWVRSMISSPTGGEFAAEDIQSTLAELTARTIATAILEHAPDVDEVLVCGGGIHNTDLMERLAGYLTGIGVTSTGDYGLDPDWVEAAAFAWLAKRRLEEKPGNLPEVTGALRPAILGAVYPGHG